MVPPLTTMRRAALAVLPSFMKSLPKGSQSVQLIFSSHLSSSSLSHSALFLASRFPSRHCSKHGTPHCSFWKSRPQIAFWLVAPSTCLPQVCSLSKCIVLSASLKHQTSHFNHTAWPQCNLTTFFRGSSSNQRPSDSSQSLATIRSGSLCHRRRAPQHLTHAFVHYTLCNAAPFRLIGQRTISKRVT